MAVDESGSLVPAWLKLVGATENQVADYWPQDQPFNFTEIWFPWNKPPSDIWQPGRIILYAVGWGALMAEQAVAGPPKIMPRRGPAGSPQNRWPHRLAVKTLFYCSPLSQAPLLRDLAPEIADRYSKRFWNGSHWRISDDEYGQLSAIIRDHGDSYPDGAAS
jgi:hypothetical protein